MFELDSRLKNDTIEILETLDCKVLLMNNANLPWFVIVPFTTKTEWFELDDSVQYNINCLINKLSQFIKNDYKTDKLNVATIGNVVKQIHIHIVGRFENDECWPAPVWGNISAKSYSQNEIDKISNEVKKLFTID